MAEHHCTFLIVFVLFFHLGKLAYLNQGDISNEKFFGLPNDCTDSNCNYFAPEKFDNFKILLDRSDEDENELQETKLKHHFDESTDVSMKKQSHQLANNDFQKLKIMNSLINRMETSQDETKDAKKRSRNDSTEGMNSIKRKWENRPRVWGKRGKYPILRTEYLELQDWISGAQEENDPKLGVWNGNMGKEYRMQKREDHPQRWNYRPKVWGKRTMRVHDLPQDE